MLLMSMSSAAARGLQLDMKSAVCNEWIAKHNHLDAQLASAVFEQASLA